MQPEEPIGRDGGGGARGGARREPAEPFNPFVIGPASSAPAEDPVPDKLEFGRVAVDLRNGNPLIVAGAPLLALVEALREHPDRFASLADIRAAAERALLAYRARIVRGDVDDATERAAEFVLTALVDDIALNGPWPGKSDWRQQPLAGLARDGRGQGQRVFDLLEESLIEPARDYAMLELIYVTLALGFEGPLRTDARGPLLLIQYRERLLMAIRREGQSQPAASVSWGSGGSRHKALAYLNPFTMLAGGLVFLVASLALAVWIFGEPAPELAADGPGAPSVLLSAELQPQPDLVPGKVASVLQGDVATKLVAVEDAGGSMVVRLSGDVFFQPGTAVLDPANSGALRRIGAAIGLAAGPVHVIAERDPASPELAAARAAELARQLGPWVRERGEDIVTFTITPDAAADSGAAPGDRIRLVLGKGVRPPSLADHGYLLPGWH
jgi:type VI secretion system protein ImpK